MRSNASAASPRSATRRSREVWLCTRTGWASDVPPRSVPGVRQFRCNRHLWDDEETVAFLALLPTDLARWSPAWIRATGSATYAGGRAHGFPGYFADRSGPTNPGGTRPRTWRKGAHELMCAPLARRAPDAPPTHTRQAIAADIGPCEWSTHDRRSSGRGVRCRRCGIRKANRSGLDTGPEATRSSRR